MEVAVWIVAIIAAATAALGFFVGVVYRKKVAEAKLGSAEVQSENLLEEAKRSAEARAKEMLLEAKEESIKTKNEAEKDAKERRNELQRLEKRLLQKEEVLDRKIEKQNEKEEDVKKKSEKLDEQQSAVSNALAKHHRELERIAGMTMEEAKKALLATIEQEARFESAKMIREIEMRAKTDADKKAKEILASAVQR